MRKNVLKLATLAVALGAAGPAMAAWDNTRNAQPAALQYSASCVVGSSVYVFGGYDATGAATKKIYKFVPSTNTWTTMRNFANTADLELTTARGEAQSVFIPGSTDQCLIVGGNDSLGGTTLATAEVFDESAKSIASGGTMANARYGFKLSACGTGSKIIVLGGKTNAPASPTTIDVFDTTPAWTTIGNLSTARAFPGFAPQDNTYDQFAIAGGENAGGRLSSVELLQVTNTCGWTSISNGTALTAARTRLELIPSDVSAGKFLALGGTTDGVTPLATTRLLTVNWAMNSNTEAAGTAMNAARMSFKVVPTSSTLDEQMILGGIGIGLNNEVKSITDTQVWDGTATQAFKTADVLNVPRHGFIAEWVSSRDKVTVAGGVKLVEAGGVAILDKTEESATP